MLAILLYVTLFKIHYNHSNVKKYYPVCGMMHIKEPLLLNGKSSLCGGSRCPLSLSECSFTICPTPYNHK